MQLGAVAILDALGFKGIWSRHNPDDVIKRLKDAKTFSDIFSDGIRAENATSPEHTAVEFSPIIRLFSDTAIIGVQMNIEGGTPSAEVVSRRETWMKHDAITVAVIGASAFLGMMLEGSLPLVFRGCIAAGKLLVDGDVFLGPAIDEAASKAPLANGGFVWLAQSAQDWIDPTVIEADSTARADSESRIDHLTFRYPIPLKSGAIYEAPVVNPFRIGDSKTRESRLQGAINAFASVDFEVEIKRKYTETMLRHALSLVEKNSVA